MKEEILAVNHAEYKATDLGEHVQPDCDLLREYLLDIRHAGNRLLEVGPGNGRAVAYLLAQGFKVDVVECESEVLVALKSNLSSAGIDATHLSVTESDILDFAPPESTYALVSASHVLHFFELPEALRLLRKFSASLVPGGLMLIRVHSKDHPASSSPNDYVKHFFAHSDFNVLDGPHYTCLYRANISKRISRTHAITRLNAEGVPATEEQIEWWISNGEDYIELLFRKEPS